MMASMDKARKPECVFQIAVINNNQMLKKAQEGIGSKSKEVKHQEQQDMSYWDLMVNGIVRPPRAKYSTEQLGNKVFNIKDKIYTREDYTVDHSGKNIELTMYHSVAEHPFQTPYVILYMHGNSSCRVEALGLLKGIPEGVSLASFDFIGCGKNQEANTISLGYREADQAKCISQYLRSMGYRVILWGRSMGAATALLYGQAQFIVADSSFKSFKSLCKQVAKEHSPAVVPNFMINCFFPCVFSKLKKDVDKRAQYDIEELDVKQSVRNLRPDTTVIFMSGNRDALINKRNSEKLYANCPCVEKHLKIFEGDHNSKRPDAIISEVMELILKHILKNQRPTVIFEGDIELKIPENALLEKGS